MLLIIYYTCHLINKNIELVTIYVVGKIVYIIK